MAYEWVDEPATTSRFEWVDEPKGSGNKAVDAGNALGTGFWRGAVRMAGLPVDTVANVLDLGRAAIGVPVTAATGSTPDWLMPSNRKNIVGSSEHLLDLARRTKAGREMVDPVNPAYEGGYLQAAGGALTGVINPKSAPEAANQAINSVLGAMAGKAAYDATGNPAWAIAAGMSPTLAQQAVTAALQVGVRGGESGRRAMEQRVQDLKNAGIDSPTLGLASGNKLIGGVENLLQSTPGAITVMGRARERALQGLQDKANEAAALASPNRGAMEAGQRIQRGIAGFKDDFKDRQAGLYDRLDQHIAPSVPVDVSTTRATLGRLNPDIPGAPALSQQFKNARIRGIEEAIKSDTEGARSGLMGSGSANTLPFEAVKKTRTLVGGELADNTIASDVPRSKWSPLYASLSDDLRTAAEAAGPGATGAFNRATDYTRAGLDRLERIAPFANTTSPEQAFTKLAATTKENVSTLQAVKKSLPDDARGSVAGTVIERLGKAKAGVQNDTGSAWSPETFLTNWNSMTPAARAELFSGFKSAPQVRSMVEDVARATSMMRDNSRMWANPSGTAAASTARGVLASVPIAGASAVSGLVNPIVPAAIAGGLLGTNWLARRLTSPSVVEMMTSRGGIPPSMQAAQYGGLVGSGITGYGLLSE